MSGEAPDFPLHRDLGGGWHQVDSGYYTAGHTSVFIVESDGRAAILDTANSAATPKILEALKTIGVPAENVDHVVISHSHLDHSGGAGTLIRELPNATCAIHPKAIDQLVDPTALIEGARGVYGDRFDSLYGTILPIPKERVQGIGEGDVLAVGGCKLEILDTPGHTFNHVCVLDKEADCVFAGDTFGVTLPPEFGVKEAMRIPAAPTQFSPDHWKDSIRRLAGLGAGRIMLSHFGAIDKDIDGKAKELIEEIDAWVGIAREARDKEDPPEHIAAQVKKTWLAKMGDEALGLPDNMLDNDINLNRMGLSLWMSKHLDDYDG